MVRLEHILTADIFATDKVLFEIAFRPGNLDAPTDTKTIGEDYVTCEMSQSSTDKASEKIIFLLNEQVEGIS